MTTQWQTPTVICADDDPEDCLLLADAVKEAGLNWNLEFVEDGEELLKHLRKHVNDTSSDQPAMILLDLNMPRKDGRQALREIKADSQLRHIPVIVLSTSTSVEDVASTFELGGNAFIPKPTSFQRFVEIMETVADFWLNTIIHPSRALDNKCGFASSLMALGAQTGRGNQAARLLPASNATDSLRNPSQAVH